MGKVKSENSVAPEVSVVYQSPMGKVKIKLGFTRDMSLFVSIPYG